MRVPNGGNHHATVVDAWLDQAAKGSPAEQLLQLLDMALAALWKRTHMTLGETTLTAIVERVIYNAAEKFPALSALKVGENGGVDCRELRQQATSSSDEALREGVRFVLREFLTVLGNLTAEILTAELHAELSRVTLSRADSRASKDESPAQDPPIQGRRS